MPHLRRPSDRTVALVVAMLAAAPLAHASWYYLEIVGAQMGFPVGSDSSRSLTGRFNGFEVAYGIGGHDKLVPGIGVGGSVANGWSYGPYDVQSYAFIVPEVRAILPLSAPVDGSDGYMSSLMLTASGCAWGMNGDRQLALSLAYHFGVIFGVEVGYLWLTPKSMGRLSTPYLMGRIALGSSYSGVAPKRAPKPAPEQFVAESNPGSLVPAAPTRTEVRQWAEDFSSTPVGEVPRRWTGGEKLCVRREGSLSYVTDFEKLVMHRLSSPTMTLPEDYQVSVRLRFGQQANGTHLFVVLGDVVAVVDVYGWCAMVQSAEWALLPDEPVNWNNYGTKGTKSDDSRGKDVTVRLEKSGKVYKLFVDEGLCVTARYSNARRPDRIKVGIRGMSGFRLYSVSGCSLAQVAVPVPPPVTTRPAAPVTPVLAGSVPDVELADLKLIDGSGNGILEPGESAYVHVNVKSTAARVLRDVAVLLTAERELTGLTYTRGRGITVLSKQGGAELAVFPIAASQDVTSDTVTFKVEAGEVGGGGIPARAELKVVVAGPPPKPLAVRAVVSGGRVARGDTAEIKLNVVNSSATVLRDVKVRIEVPVGVRFLGSTQVFSFDELQSGEAKEVRFSVAVDDPLGEELVLLAELSEGSHALDYVDEAVFRLVK